MKYTAPIVFSLFLLLLSGCQTVAQSCPTVTGTPQFLTASPHELPTSTPVKGPIQVEIGRKTIQVNKVVEGPLCNDTWSGTVYVTCNVQVYPWEEHPTFLKDCDLNIEPGTVVYVAYHKNAAYYNGCSCHTGITSEP